MKKKCVYISAPISGRSMIIVNKVFSNAERELHNLGFNTINPLKLNHHQGSSYGEQIAIDIQELIDNADAVYFCKGWSKSNGCMLEFAAAKIYGKEMHFE